MKPFQENKPECEAIKSFDKKGRVIYISTFSKILAPGFRLGWAIASKDILDNSGYYSLKISNYCLHTSFQ